MTSLFPSFSAQKIEETTILVENFTSIEVIETSTMSVSHANFSLGPPDKTTYTIVSLTQEILKNEIIFGLTLLLTVALILVGIRRMKCECEQNCHICRCRCVWHSNKQQLEQEKEEKAREEEEISGDRDLEAQLAVCK